MNFMDYYVFIIIYNLLNTPAKLCVAAVLGLLLGHYLIMLKQKIGMPPGPIPLPFIGTLYHLPKDRSEAPIEIGYVCKKYGGICTLILPDLSRVVILTDINLIRETFIRNVSTAGRPFVNTWATTLKIFEPNFPTLGLLFAQYDEQFKLQKHASMMALKSVGFGNTNMMENKIVEEMSHVITAFRCKNGKSFNPRPIFAVAALNFTCSLLFNERFDYENEEALNLLRCVKAVLAGLASPRFINNMWIVKHLPSQKKRLKLFAEDCKCLNHFVEMKVRERKSKMEDFKECEDFITSYLREVQNLNGKLEDRACQTVKDFFLAGMDTASTALSWIFYFLTKYPEVQEKVRKELCAVVGERKFTTLNDRRNLPYTEATLAEIMRLGPPVPSLIPHCTVADTVIAGYNIPKGTEVGGLFMPTLWNPALFPEPHVFKPERHLDSHGQFIRNDCLITFGVGRRSCLGEQFAKQQLFLFMTHLVQIFQFKIPEGEEFPPHRGKCAVTYAPQIYNISAVPL